MSLKYSKGLERRAFLRGAGGALVALPALEAFTLRHAGAQPPAKKIYSAFVMQVNGHIIEQFNPSAPGPLSAATMTGIDASKATSELKDHAADITIIKGIDHAYDVDNGCGHPMGGNVVLTGSKPTGTDPRSLPRRESADYRIAQAYGKEPLNLYAGRKESYLADCFAYGPGGKIRPANNKPFDVYTSMMGLSGTPSSDPTLVARIAAREKSINDLARTQLQDLFRRSDLSMEDRRRLTVYFDSIRELEVEMTRPVMSAATGAGERSLSEMAMSLKDRPDANDLMEDAVRAQMSLIALAFAADRVPAATLQIGAGQDQTQYMIDGKRAMGYHSISHGVNSGPGTPGRNAGMATLHHRIDRIHARYFKHFIEQLKKYKTVAGRALLDDTVAVWTNQLASGYNHLGFSVPHVLAGSAGGFLKKGHYVEVKGVKNNKFLNTIITAGGVRKANGDPVDDHGDAELPKGLMPELLA